MHFQRWRTSLKVRETKSLSVHFNLYQQIFIKKDYERSENYEKKKKSIKKLLRHISLFLLWLKTSTCPFLWRSLKTEVFVRSPLFFLHGLITVNLWKMSFFRPGITCEGITMDYPKAPLRFIPNANGVVSGKMMMWCRGFLRCTNMTVIKKIPLTNDKLF